LSEGLKKEELYDRLLSSLGVDDNDDSDEALEEFRREAPVWFKEIKSMFFHLMNELTEVATCRDPKGQTRIQSGNLLLNLCREFDFIREEVEKRIRALPAEELANVDRVRVKAEFQGVVSKSGNLSDQIRDDLLKILSNPHKEHDNLIRGIWGLQPLPAEEGGRWDFIGGHWRYDDGIRPRWDGSRWVTNHKS